MFEKIKAFTGAHKTAVRVGAVVLALAIGGGAFAAVRLRQKPAAAGSEDITFSRTVKLEKGALLKTVNVSGTVQSGSVSSVTATLTGKIISVNVKVGEKVKKGDVIAVQDTGDIDKEIKEKRAALGEDQKALSDSVSKLASQLSSAKNSKAATLKEQDALVQAASAAKSSAQSALDGAVPAMSAAQREYDLMLSAIRPAQTAADEAERARQAAYESWLSAGGRQTAEDGSADPLYTAYQAAEQTAQDKQTELSAAKTLYDTDRYTTAYNTIKPDYDAKRAAHDTAVTAYDQAVANRQKVMNEIDSSIADLTAQVVAAQEKVKKGSSAKELEDLIKRKEAAVLRAETDGEVTDLKAVVGSVPKDTIATIQSTDNLVLAVKIAEYDINRVKLGLTANITADSITTPATGSLSRISPTAESGDSSSSGFSADILITRPEGLHIGSKAKAEIVLSSKEGVLLAPIDAVGEGAEGSFVKVVENGEVREIPVTVGEKNDYHIEISGAGLSEQTEILANADWAGLAADAAANQESGMGGF